MFDHADEMVRDKRGMTFAEWETLGRELAKALEGRVTELIPSPPYGRVRRCTLCGAIAESRAQIRHECVLAQAKKAGVLGEKS